MLYTDLDKMPLDTFIDIFCGEKDKLIIKGKHTPEEIDKQYTDLVSQYMEIVGGTSLLAEINKRNGLIDLHIKIHCMSVASVMIDGGEWKKAAEILSQFGYNIPYSEHDKIRRRVSSLQSVSQYMLARIQSEKKETKPAQMDKDYFVRERVMVMSHFGMQIRKNEITAKEYAFMVRRMCDDIKSINNARRK